MQSLPHTNPPPRKRTSTARSQGMRSTPCDRVIIRIYDFRVLWALPAHNSCARMNKSVTSGVCHPCARIVGQSWRASPDSPNAASTAAAAAAATTTTTAATSSAAAAATTTTARRRCGVNNNTAAQKRNKRQTAPKLVRKARDSGQGGLRQFISANPHNAIADLYRAGQLCCRRCTVKCTGNSHNHRSPPPPGFAANTIPMQLTGRSAFRAIWYSRNP